MIILSYNMDKQNYVKISTKPFIKWTGSKRSQAKEIVDKFPKMIDNYFEGFVGGGSVMHELLNRIYTGEIKCNSIICSDLNWDLIELWKMLVDKNKRKKLLEYYSGLHYKLKAKAGYISGPVTSEHVQLCQSLYYEMRDKYNDMIVNNIYNEERAMIFYWITRTSFNGLIRYNPKTGKFNAPFHVGGRFGITPEELKDVFDSWALVIDDFINKGGDITFECRSFEEVIKTACYGDVVYLDPPYDKVAGAYFCNEFSVDLLNDTIEKITENQAKVLLSYDGTSGDEDRTSDKIRPWYKTHEYVNSGRSSFKGLKSASRGVGSNDIVKDSLYINY